MIFMVMCPPDRDEQSPFAYYGLNTFECVLFDLAVRVDGWDYAFWMVDSLGLTPIGSFLSLDEYYRKIVKP